jgi:hypothetical protein
MPYQKRLILRRCVAPIEQRIIHRRLNSPEIDQETREEDQQRLDKYRQTKQGIPHYLVVAWLDSIIASI